MDAISPEAGPSRLPAHPTQSPTHTAIPSFGPEFFEYRRRLFLAGLPLPPNPPSPLPESYTVPLPFPDPIPAPPNDPGPTVSSVGKLEALLQEEGAEETMAAWTAGLAGVHARLDGGKRLSRPLKLGLVIKVLKAETERGLPTLPPAEQPAHPLLRHSRLSAHKPPAELLHIRLRRLLKQIVYDLQLRYPPPQTCRQRTTHPCLLPDPCQVYLISGNMTPHGTSKLAEMYGEALNGTRELSADSSLERIMDKYMGRL